MGLGQAGSHELSMWQLLPPQVLAICHGEAPLGCPPTGVDPMMLADSRQR
jgi:hypothetical protein